jgi:hypothetical protein
MDRVRLIAGSHRWLLLAALSLLALALGTAMFSGAKFTSRSANTASLVTGNVQLSSTKPNEATIVSAAAMKPGESRSGTITIGNEGNVTGTVSLAGTGLTGTALAAVIDFKLEDITGGVTTQKWSGKLGAFPGVGLGNFAVNEKHEYRLTLSWPSGSNEAALQGTSTSLTFQWRGVSWSGA